MTVHSWIVAVGPIESQYRPVPSTFKIDCLTHRKTFWGDLEEGEVVIDDGISNHQFMSSALLCKCHDIAAVAPACGIAVSPSPNLDHAALSWPNPT